MFRRGTGMFCTAVYWHGTAMFSAPRCFEVYCPMAKAGWLQADKNVKNPYMGSDLLTFGVIKE